MTCACDLVSGSWYACVERTVWSVWRKVGFSVNVVGVGGRDVVVPIEWVDSVGRRERVWDFLSGDEKMYCSDEYAYTSRMCEAGGRTMYGTPSRVDTDRTCVLRIRGNWRRAGLSASIMNSSVN